MVRQDQGHRKKGVPRAQKVLRPQRAGGKSEVHENGALPADLRSNLLLGEGENEREKQAGATPTRSHQRLCFEARREDQRDHTDLAIDHCQKVLTVCIIKHQQTKVTKQYFGLI